MGEINVKLVYNVKKDRFKISGNAKNPKKIVMSFIRTQVGAGVDDSPAEEKDKYTILISLDLSEDTFSVCNDCGNKGLRDGILMRFCSGN